ncbi:uncharacterized protein V1510DRAFT_430911 [Dipodascopsis tothii]|uniref:uncharacterized protein n=1 Tax=Dipodascopsis tothii TaxID=44089 RepID=UPI0034CF4A1F
MAKKSGKKSNSKPAKGSRKPLSVRQVAIGKPPSAAEVLLARRRATAARARKSEPASAAGSDGAARSFGDLLVRLAEDEAEQAEEAENTIISRHASGEGEITFKVKSAPARRSEDDGERRKGSGRVKQRFDGRRSASKNVMRTLG